MIKGLTPEAVAAMAKAHGAHSAEVHVDIYGEPDGIFMTVEDLYRLLTNSNGSD